MKTIKAKLDVVGKDLTKEKVLEHLQALIAKYEAGLLKPTFSNSVIYEFKYELRDLS